MEEGRGAFFEAGDALGLVAEDLFDRFQAANNIIEAFILKPTGAENGRHQGQGDLKYRE